MTDSLDRFNVAHKLGSKALLRLRAEVLLGYADDGRVSVSVSDRETLERITVVANEDDLDFLRGFDDQVEASMNEDDYR